MNQSTAVSTERREAPPAKAPIVAGGAVAAMNPQDFEQAWRMATALAAAGDMVPKAFQGNPNATLAAIMRGAEVGLAPMQALASIAVINGRASVWGDALPALMQRAGHHVDVDYEGEGDKLVAVASLTRGDTGKVVVRRFGMADAKRAGLAGKQGPWQQFPQRMIAMRARAWAIRDGAADALMGLSIGEEVSDYGPDRARDVTPGQPPAPRKGGVVYADPEPAAEADVIHEGEVVEDDDPTPTEEQRAAAMADAEAASRAMAEEGR